MTTETYRENIIGSPLYYIDKEIESKFDRKYQEAIEEGTINLIVPVVHNINIIDHRDTYDRLNRHLKEVSGYGLDEFDYTTAQLLEDEHVQKISIKERRDQKNTLASLPTNQKSIILLDGEVQRVVLSTEDEDIAFAISFVEGQTKFERASYIVELIGKLPKNTLGEI